MILHGPSQSKQRNVQRAGLRVFVFVFAFVFLIEITTPHKQNGHVGKRAASQTAAPAGCTLVL
jgi:hypothetical protein